MSRTRQKGTLDDHSYKNGVYDSLKERLINRRLPSEERITIDRLADQLFVSATPVREALTRLASEGLVFKVNRAGFFPSPLHQTEIFNIYETLELLLTWSLKQLSGQPLFGARNASIELFEDPISNPESLARYSRELFLAIGAESGNTEIKRLVQNFMDRSYYAHKQDLIINEASAALIKDLSVSYKERNFERASSLVTSHYSGLRERLPELFRHLETLAQSCSPRAISSQSQRS